MFRFLARLGRDATGATAVEYGLILALIFVAILGGVSALGGGTAGAWTNIANSITTAA